MAKATAAIGRPAGQAVRREAEEKSFPSSHAARGAAYAAVLAELFPGKNANLLDRGEQIGEDRMIAGIHFPSDVEAGQRIGKAVPRELMADPPSSRT